MKTTLLIKFDHGKARRAIPDTDHFLKKISLIACENYHSHLFSFF